MRYVDKLRPPMRQLVYEFGLLIVADMIDEGYSDADALRSVLEQWRSTRQEKWLATNYVNPPTGRSMRRNFERALGDGENR